VNINQLIADVRTLTDASELYIHALARENWPTHSTFTTTQVLLMAALIERKKETPNANLRDSQRRPVENARRL
jgi:hypothetical protein